MDSHIQNTVDSLRKELVESKESEQKLKKQVYLLKDRDQRKNLMIMEICDEQERALIREEERNIKKRKMWKERRQAINY